MILTTVIAEKSRRLPTMAEAADLLERAHTCVSMASDHWAALDGFDAAAASLQCREIVQLLEECGATASGSLPPPGLEALTGGRLLAAAAAALDEIPAPDRAPRLTVARAVLAGALLHASVEDSD